MTLTSLPESISTYTLDWSFSNYIRSWIYDIHSKDKVSVLGTGDTEREITTGRASILARVIDKQVVEIKASFLTFDQDT